MREGYWVVRTYEAGAVGEKTKFFIPGKRPTGKDRRREKSEIKKQEQNEYSSKKQLARLINSNFGAGDILLGIDYSDAGLKKIFAALYRSEEYKLADTEEKRDMEFRAADHAAALYIRRLKRELKKDGVELRYILVTSDMDGDTKERVRVHHHIIVNAEAGEKLTAKWGHGSVDIKKLSQQGDYTPLAEYLMNQVRRIENVNKYVSSRNLIRPQPKDRVALSDAPLRVPKGGKLIYCAEYRPNTPHYIRYFTGKGNSRDRGTCGQTAVRCCAAQEGRT